MNKTEDWLDSLTQESEAYQDLILNRRLNDASGLGTALTQMIRMGPDERYPGVLLTGPEGAGKHNAAYHVIQALDEEDFAPVFLTGEDLNEVSGEAFVLTDRLNALLARFYDRKQNLCLVLEEPELCTLSRKLYFFLGRTLWRYLSASAEEPALYLILIAEKQPPLPDLLREPLLLCPCSLPDREQREAFLSEKGKTIHNYVSLKRLAELSEGCSYAALLQLVDILGFRIDATDQVPEEEELRRCVRQLLPERELPQGPVQNLQPAASGELPAPERTAAGLLLTERDSSPVAESLQRLEGLIAERLRRENESNPVAESLQRLEKVFTDMLEMLGELDLSNLNGSSGTARRISSGDDLEDIPQTTSAEPDKSEIEAMPISKLAEELFGAERAAQLLTN